MPRISFDSRVTVRKAIFKIRLSQNLQRIRFLVMDVDGTLTDGQVFIGANGEIFKNFNIKDGLGIADILPDLNITPIIITGRKSEMLAQRCKELKIEELHQGVSDKLSVLNRIVDVAGERLSSVCYVGDDINDLACMKEVKRKGGYVACPQDAAKQIKSIAHCALTSPGGKGAVRELIDILVANRRS
ncbi:3-deoxy-D-manno-octulosonate 8-phosphate phosphatase [Collinsella tanakaei]|nr:3-deoxy-D-manno-octulosonate 8-phosphate phosphatase [Collinsella tanakaei]